MILLLLVFDLLSCANGDTFSLVVPGGVIPGQLGSSVVLPCTVSPALDCTSYEVGWYGLNDKENPILLYKDLKVQEDTGDPRYRNRVSLTGELGKGNVSLKLEQLTLTDRGEYECYVNSDLWYDRASVFLNLSAVGSLPVLSFTEAGEQVNVTCASGGWLPTPTLTWRAKEGQELKKSVNHYITDSEGLVSVSSWLLVFPSESEWISCSVGLSDQEMKEGRVLPLKHDSGVSPGWTAFIISLVISLLMLVVMAVFIFKVRGRIFPEHSQKKSPSTGPLEEEGVRLVAPETTNQKRSPDKETQGPLEEEGVRLVDPSPPPGPVCAVREINRTDGEPQTSVEFKPPPSSDGATQTSGPETANKETNTDEIPDWDTMYEHKVAIKPGVSEAKGVLFKERIRSGQYFWVVKGVQTQTTQSLNNTNQNPTLWYVGVTNQTVLRESNCPLTPQNGYWVLQYDRDKGYHVNDSFQTQTVTVEGHLSELGVFLDCKKHTLSFYDRKSKLHLYTFFNVPSTATSPLIPVIYPGLKLLDICKLACVNCDELYLQ